MKYAAVTMLLSASIMLTAPLAAQTVVNRKFKETSLGAFPKEAQTTAIVSPDARHVAYVRGGNTVVLDGRPQKTYAKVAGLSFSPDGKWLAYAAQSGQQWLVVVGPREETAFARVGEPVFSNDSKRLAYVAQQADGSRTVVVNAKPGKAYQRIFAGLLVFSPDGQRLAYGALADGKWHLVCDDRVGPPVEYFGDSSGIVFSADGTQTACAVLNADKTWSAMFGDQKQPPYQEIGDVALSADGNRWAYAALKKDQWRVVVDGKEQKAFDTIGAGTLRFSPDGKTLLYAARAERKWRLVFNGREEPPYDGIADILISPDSKLIAYTVQIERSEMVVLNTRPQRIYDRVGGGTLVFSPSGKHLGYVGLSGKASFVCIDGKRKPRYDLVGYLNFTPDSEHHVYAATRGDKAFTVIDDQEAAHQYDSIWNYRSRKMQFDHRKKFHYLGIKQGQIYLVEEELD